jgi:hypothetical protein
VWGLLKTLLGLSSTLSSLFTSCGKINARPNSPAPSGAREGGEFKASLLAGERFGERFSRSREKSATLSGEESAAVSSGRDSCGITGTTILGVDNVPSVRVTAETGT